MGIEIERKFLVANDSWRNADNQGSHCKQGYLALGPPASVRVRIMDGRATLNIKQATLDIARAEYEYPIPMVDAEELMTRHTNARLVEKTRFIVGHADHRWEIDVFHGANAGLILAEIELRAKDETFKRPLWLGAEVSGDARYLNSSLAVKPWSEWGEEGQSSAISSSE